MKFVVDVFGGDNAPNEILAGCTLALSRFDDFELILTGDEDAIRRGLGQELAAYQGRITIIHAPGVVETGEPPVEAIKQKKDSSLVAALNVMARKEADVFISAGNTGAVMAGATLIVRRIPGVKRPALAPLLPTAKGKSVLLVDCGANVDCKPEYLQQFALMGSCYMKEVVGVYNPRVGLINNGAEAEKGCELTKAAYKLLETSPINFCGNCEGRDVHSGDFDVVVADGFAGNIVLKHTEGLAEALIGMLKKELSSGLREKLGAALLMPALKRFKSKMDYTEYGGALLLGIDGGIIKAHGSSNARAIFNTIRQAREFVKGSVIEKIKQNIVVE